MFKGNRFMKTFYRFIKPVKQTNAKKNISDHLLLIFSDEILHVNSSNNASVRYQISQELNLAEKAAEI